MTKVFVHPRAALRPSFPADWEIVTPEAEEFSRWEKHNSKEFWPADQMWVFHGCETEGIWDGFMHTPLYFALIGEKGRGWPKGELFALPPNT